MILHFRSRHFGADHLQPIYGAGVAGGILADDIVSASSVTTPVVAQRQVLDATNVASASSVTAPTASEIEAGAILAEDVISASFVSTPTLVVQDGEVIPPIHGPGGGYGYYRRRRRDEEEDEPREKRIRDLGEIIDQAIARVRAELEPEPEAGPPAPGIIAAVDDGLAAIQDSLRAIETLDRRIVEADAELAELWQRAVDLVAEAALVDDDESLMLLLVGTVQEEMGMAVDEDDDEAVLELLLAA